MVRLGCERGFGFVQPGVYLYHPKFRYLFFFRPVCVYITIIIVVWLRGCLVMMIEPVELVFLYIVFTPIIREWYARFVREDSGLYSLGYAHTIQSFGIYSPPDLYEYILP